MGEDTRVTEARHRCVRHAQEFGSLPGCQHETVRACDTSFSDLVQPGGDAVCLVGGATQVSGSAPLYACQPPQVWCVTAFAAGGRAHWAPIDSRCDSHKGGEYSRKGTTSTRSVKLRQLSASSRAFRPDNRDDGGAVETSNNQLGAAVRTRRRELNLTQQEIAQLADIASSSWSEMERGAWVPQRDGTRIGIARSLGWEPDALSEMLGDREDDQASGPGAAFRWRRENIGLTIDELSNHVHRSSATIRSLESGTNVSKRSQRAIAWGLGWPDDAYERLDKGESPEDLEVEAEGGDSEETLAALRSLLRGAGLTQMQVQLVENIASDFMDGSTK